MQIFQVNHPRSLTQLMRDIKVDPYGIKIMVPKAVSHLVRLRSISNIAANILKQEMLSLGGDAAVGRDALTGKARKTDCLLIGNLSQFNRLNTKLSAQPFGLDGLVKTLAHNLKQYQRDTFVLALGRHKLNLRTRTHIMGVVNVTPDSFSGDGLYQQPLSAIIAHARSLVADGADIIDIGGQSSRPGAKAVSLKEEIKRVIPVVDKLARTVDLPLSIDTAKPEVARLALAHGASLINDITGLRNPAMPRIAARYKAGVVIMHMKGSPRTMQDNPTYECLIGEIIGYLEKAIAQAVSQGVDREKIIVDPGIGFGKTVEHNIELLRRLEEFKVLGRPIMVGPSRKSFIGKILDIKDPQERLFGTVAACVAASRNGARIVRVHDVKAVRQGLRVLDRVQNT
ncbi:MAG TPA: dihydropteroate synthase [Patescibacteria group bacterium]|nr:dihydropteroate synthase [Patescibacteria group bacterium]